MLRKICSIHDVKAEAWLDPLTFRSTGEAVRAFGDAVRNKESDFGKHPEDYHLYVVATFDPLTGRVETQDAVELIHGANVQEL